MQSSQEHHLPKEVIIFCSVEAMRVQAGHRHRAPAQASKWITLSPCKELTGVKKTQEVTNKSYQSSHSPERQHPVTGRVCKCYLPHRPIEATSSYARWPQAPRSKEAADTGL